MSHKENKSDLRQQDNTACSTFAIYGKNEPRKLNCWEFKRCGREPGGARVNELGVCPVIAEERADGIHDGRMGGRACWVISGTYCEKEVERHFAQQLGDCKSCYFYNSVVKEEGRAFKRAKEILKMLKSE